MSTLHVGRQEMTLQDKIIFILIGILIGMSSGLYAGATITDNHAERYRTESINNAVSVALESSRTQLNCKDNDIIEAVKNLAKNGKHVEHFWLYFDSKDLPFSDNPESP